MPGDDPTKFSDAQLETGRLLFAGECTFLKGVTRVPDLPPPDRLEVAFAGRSNVGKSSLLNALTGRKGLARTSNTPGRTQEVNFFSIGASLYLVDMPGYGYAKASKDKVRAWTELIHDYLRGRVSLRRVFLLIDSRHGPKPSDETIMQMLDVAAVSYQVVLTKSDKISATARTNIVNHTSAMLSKRPAAYPDILLTSANKGTGIAELRAEIAAFLDD